MRNIRTSPTAVFRSSLSSWSVDDWGDGTSALSVLRIKTGSLGRGLLKSCLAHTDTTCGEGAYQDPREDSPNPTHRCLRLGSTPKSHHISDAPSSEESTDKDKPSKVPPPNCSQWGPRLQHHMRVWQGKGTASCSKCRRTRVCSPRTHSRPSHCNILQVSILEKRKKFPSFTESFRISVFQKSVLLSTGVNFWQNAATRVCHREAISQTP